MVGAGAVGAAVLDQLARSGIGTIKVIDRDVIEASNLGRQALYTDADARAGLPKAIAIGRHLAAINPAITIEPIVADLDARTIASLLSGVDLILDGTDNLETRYLVNDFAVERGITWIYGGCVGSRGLTAVVIPGVTRCLRCVYPDAPPPGTLETCETAGVIAPVATLIASLEAAEALKILTGAHGDVRTSWICLDLWPFRMAEIGGASSAPRADCPCCGDREFPFLRRERAGTAATLCGRDAVHVVPATLAKLDLDTLATRLAPLGSLKRHEFVIVFSAGGFQLTVFDDGRALVKGTSDPVTARSLYDRYIGT